ncbi:MAG: AAA family ATPase [Solirubrobacterales bacterium]
MSTPAVARDELLEREVELSEIDGRLGAAAGGRGSALLIAGEAGIGKSELLRSATAMAAERGLRTLEAFGGELERELPFGIVRQLFGPPIASADEDERRRLLDGAAGLAGPAVDPVVAPAEAPATFATLHGLYWLTAALAADNPVVILVDDVQWADSASLRFLAYLAPRIAELPVVLVAAQRRGESGAERDELRALSAAAGVLDPSALSVDAVGSLVGGILGISPDARFAEVCRRATGGNPFLARELAAELRDRGATAGPASAEDVETLAPPRVARAVNERIAGLGPGATELAAAIAVLGNEADLATAGHVANLAPAAAAEAADRLARAGILEPKLAFRFIHPIVRTAVAEAMGPGELDAAHRRAAGILSERATDPDLIVAHLAATAPQCDAGVASALLDGARRAVGRGAPAEAAALLRRAIVEPPGADLRHRVLLELGIAELRASDQRSIEHLERALDEADGAEQEAESALALGKALGVFGHFGTAVDVFDRGLAAVTDGGELSMELEAESLAASTLSTSKRPMAPGRIDELAARLEPTSTAACKLLAGMAREEMSRLGSRRTAIDLAERSLEGGHLMSDEPLVSLPFAPMVLMYAGEVDRAIDLYDGALRQTRHRGAVLSAALVSGLRGMALQIRGELVEATDDTREALEDARRFEAPVIGTYLSGFLAWMLIARGELDEAEALLTDAEGVTGLAESFSSHTFARTRAELRIEQGRFEEAATDLRRCGEGLIESGVRNPGISNWRSSLALVQLQLGERTEAETLATEEVELAREWGAGWILCHSLRVAGVVAGADGEELLREAVTVGEQSGAKLRQARALVDLGGLLRRSGDRRASREPLREGLDLALACGARALSDRALEELLASGAQPRRLRESGPDALTPAERRVAAMAAEGMTNRAVAQALFVSEKTVESQLGSVFRKLEIGSRAQLPEALSPAPGAETE